MRSSVMAIVSVIGFLAPWGALAQGEQPAPTPDKNAAVAAAQTVTCHYVYHEGMLIRRQICHTQAEWNNIRYENQREISDFETRALTTSIR